MISMTMHDLAARIGSILPEIKELSLREGLDEFEERAFRFLFERLSQIMSECEAGALTKDPELKGAIARLVVESSPGVLRHELGGRILRLESAYYELNKEGRRSE